MAHTKESIAKMLATRAANRAAKHKAGKKGNGHGNGHHGPRIPEAVVLLTQVARTMPKQVTALSENDLAILQALRALTRKRPEDRAEG